MAAWGDRFNQLRADHNTAVAAGGIAHAAHLGGALARAAEFRNQAIRMVTEARQYLASSDGAEAHQRRFSEELFPVISLSWQPYCYGFNSPNGNNKEKALGT